MKRPGRIAEPQSEKRPVALEPQDWRDDYPSWRVREVLLVDPFGWHNINTDQMRQIHGRLSALERMTWREILNPSMGRRKHHFMPVGEIPKDAQRQLEEKKLGDTDDLVSLRIGKAERVWGILQGSTLLLLWWDPFHLVYKMDVTG